MKIYNKIPLRMRITLLSGGVILLTAICMTLVNVKNADIQFAAITRHQAIEEITYQIDAQMTQLPQGTVPAVSIEPVQIGDNLLKAVTLATSAAKQRFDYGSYIYMAVFAVLGMAAIYVISGRALKPIKQLDEAVTGIGAHNLTKRIPQATSHDEIQSLTASFNSMLERLEQSFERQKQFSANVSHELKTPIAVMDMAVQILDMEENPDAAEYSRTVELVRQNVKRLSDIVNDLICLVNDSALTLGDCVDLDSMVEKIEAELSPLYGEKQIRIIKNLQTKNIFGNEPLLHRAFLNLIDNAMKYNEQGGTVEIFSGDIDGEQIIYVENMGSGIGEKHLERIFEPFYRIDQSRSRKIAGSGLGLSLVKSIFDRHGYEVSASSGDKTRFSVKIKPCDFE